jgi:hypothetical protein
MRLCPIGAISQEVVRFDMQAMENPEMRGVSYQQGTLAGYEAREYLLEVRQEARWLKGESQKGVQFLLP